MALPLTPHFAAELADNVYAIEPGLTDDAFFQRYRDEMLAPGARLATGVTGCVLSKEKLLAVYARGTGGYRDQAFVAFKGTADLYDGLTDINTGVRNAATGHPVHQGFLQAFDSVRGELERFVVGQPGLVTVHCVGHSLGGAIATLAADWLAAGAWVAQVQLYSFGSPRVGLQAFAGDCTRRLKARNVYRVHHQTDPVPMVPTWPFWHVPSPGADYLLASPVPLVPWEYHKMKHYIASVKDAGSWPKVARLRPPSHTDAALQAWLQSDGVLSLTANTLELLNAAMQYVVQRCVQAAGIFLVSAFASSFTLLDRLAHFMAEAARVSVTAGTWVMHLVRRMAVLAGLRIQRDAALTVDFIRSVFLKLHHAVVEMVRAIQRAMH